MKKHCTRIASLALVLALLISAMVPAFAAVPLAAEDTLPENGTAAEETVGVSDQAGEVPGEEPEAEPAAVETSAEEPEPAPVNDAPVEETPAEDVPEETETAQEMSDAVQEKIALLAETDADGFTKGTEEGSDYWWKLENGTLTVKGTKMADWTFSDKAPWYAVRDVIQSLVIEEGVTNIGDCAFYECSGLTGTLTIPDSVTSIGDYAFFGCSGLTGNLTIPEGVTSIGGEAFHGCSGLTGDLIIPAGVTSIGDDAFSGCSGLTGALTIPEGVTYIGSTAFQGCNGLTSVTIPSSMTSIGGWTFYGCRGLTSVTIPESVTSIGKYAFSDCSGLTGVTIPESVTCIEARAFYNCSNLKEIYFKGNAPQFSVYDDGIANTFKDVTATIYYPQDNATWTEEVRQQYGGTLTWAPYDPANPPSMEPEDSEAPEDQEDPEKPTDPEKPETPEDPENPTAPEDPTDSTPGDSNTWKDTGKGVQYLGADGKPLTGSNWIEALGHRYVFDDNGILQTGNTDGDLLWEGNQYYLNPDRNTNDPSTCYCVINYTRRRDAGVTYYNQDGITYRGWVDGGDGKLLYQTVLRDKNGKELKDEAGFSTYIYVWGGQQIPEGRDPLDKEKTIAAGNYLFGEDGVLVTGRTGWYTIPGSSAIAGEYYLTAADGQCALNTTIWDDAKGHRYLFGADGRKMSAGPEGLDVALTINGQYQTVYLAPNTDYVACEYYRPRKDSKGGDLGLTYYNPDGITYRGWVDGGSGKRLYQTVMKIEGKDLYFIVWRAQYLPAGKDPVTRVSIPAGWYLFGDDGVLITEDGVYTCPDTKGVDHRYQVKGGKIVAIDGKAPTAPGGK